MKVLAALSLNQMLSLLPSTSSLEKNTVLKSVKRSMSQLGRKISQRCWSAVILYRFTMNFSRGRKDISSLTTCPEESSDITFSPKRSFQRIEWPSTQVKYLMVSVSLPSPHLALMHMHNKEIYYEGFTPEDVNISGDGHIKMTNIFLTPQPDSSSKFNRNPFFSSPERVRWKGNPALQDFYSLGIFILMILGVDTK